MGTDASEVVDTLPSPCSFKVHHAMCTELKKLVDAITNILPEIEVSRPGCSSGIQILCLLNSAIEKANLLLQYCSDSSKLYLVITGDVIVSRFQKSRNLLAQSLAQVQNSVPVMLAAEMSRIIDDIRDAVFVPGQCEEEAGEVLRDLLRLSVSKVDTIESSESKALQLASLRLEITTSKAILLEKRLIKKLLDKVSNSSSPKVKILKYLLYLLKKYGTLITVDQTEISGAKSEDSFEVSCMNNESVGVQSVELECQRNERCDPQHEISNKSIPPAEYQCPISMRLMYDPVVIASGRTFERMWIQKWFDEGNNTCPKTEKKLAHLLLTPNTVLKDLILRWCLKYNITLQDPCMQPEALNYLENSSTSFASFGSSMNDLRLPSCDSSNSLRSLDNNYFSETSHGKVRPGSILKRTSGDLQKYEHSANSNEPDMKSLSKLSDLPWNLQCRAVKDFQSHLRYNDQPIHCSSVETIVESMIKFLKKACDLQDVNAEKAALQIMLALVSKSSRGVESMSEDAFTLLSCLLDSEVTEEALNLMEELSAYSYCQSKSTLPGALSSILKLLDSQVKIFREQAMKILQNLSSSNKICFELLNLECIPRLVPLLRDNTLSRHCIIILKNLCNVDLGRVSVVETIGSIDAIIELLEVGSYEVQEHAVDILLMLCSQRDQYCVLGMDETVISALVNISVNGSKRAKASALELLRILQYDDGKECIGSDLGRFDSFEDENKVAMDKKLPSKKSMFFGMRLSANKNVTDLKSLSRLSDLPWHLQCRAVKDVQSRLKYNDQAIHSSSAETIVESMIQFLKKACDLQDVNAKKAGLNIMLALVSKSSRGVESMSEDAFSLLSYLLDSEVTKEALNLMEVLCYYSCCQSKSTLPGALSSILEILDSQVKVFQEYAMKILQNLSTSNKICFELLNLECTPRLVPLLKDNTLSRYCIIILRNLCNVDLGRVSVVETTGSMDAIIELLEIGCHEVQEHAVDILLMLCSQRDQYCMLGMDETAISALVNISVNGNRKTKASAYELLRILQYDDEQECIRSDLARFVTFKDANKVAMEKKLPSKKSMFFGMRLPVFSKSS